MSDWSVKLHEGIHAIPAKIWDGCAGADNPFISHAFLSALEDSKSVCPDAGWMPRHIALHAPDGTLAGLCPAYFKMHSWGEYVFDQRWAQAFEAAGGHYYPKLLSAVPFSPVTGPRLLIHPDAPAETSVIMTDAIRQICESLEFSSAHITFCTVEESNITTGRDWLPRLGVQYHWHNNGYKSFDDFLAALSSRKRKTIKRERRDTTADLTFHVLRGTDITEADWADFYRFYENTIDRKWSSAYLTPEFFTLLSQRLGERVVLMQARSGTRTVAAALNLMGTDTLYGRNWGCEGEWPFLHFELCYYQAIDFAIAHGLKRVEAGAQGEHKIQRGYQPVLTHSAHWLCNSSFRNSVSTFLEHERAAIKERIAELNTLSPYRSDES
ncbi:GNAT family N-acetyltransferase [Acetobacter thailandicus]|uniref:GNAT family N-acetyltransferase n=1 Tax=Acetobacter thailandicus TaxID=1502842 RepID=A0ABT3QD82_9PROT|nr:GNAT family N-acetyltransferase [Acetobacter thailandicus]MCX2563251.1 GNAT family N-acetyltransferase [Acetobacter thailandicus]NHN94007.1 GNAT family N-acetyltransferase [Acetobacter thailandicus]